MRLGAVRPASEDDHVHRLVPLKKVRFAAKRLSRALQHNVAALQLGLGDGIGDLGQGGGGVAGAEAPAMADKARAVAPRGAWQTRKIRNNLRTIPRKPPAVRTAAAAFACTVTLAVPFFKTCQTDLLFEQKNKLTGLCGLPTPLHTP
jgi:hypothetical protein